ncbi:MAG TPA: isochorismatase family cysteine hydrolase [Solirubrobacterales bacterium]|nr:isochorismatase family cysteine hydrolase [Solirubrobacterales bacterium]
MPDRRDDGRRPRRHQPDGEREPKTALLIVDMLNPYEHEDSERLAEHVAAALPGVEALIDRARELELPTVYVNDNFGDWNSSSEELAERAREGAHPELVEPILPAAGASFVIKARHSTFYETPLEYLLDQMGVDRLVLSGQVTEQCILYSALDAHVRHFKVAIATDAVAAIHDHLAEAALEMADRNLSAELGRANELAL